MTNSVIKTCNFLHYFFREGGYLDCDQFSLLLFSLSMDGGRVRREIVPNSLYSLFFYFELFPKWSICVTQKQQLWPFEKMNPRLRLLLRRFPGANTRPEPEPPTPTKILQSNNGLRHFILQSEAGIII